MKIEINEEEQEFLYRVCMRAELFCEMSLSIGNPRREKDLEKIRSLLEKLKI